MTVPALMQNHQKKTYVTQLHKVYNQLSQAVVLYMTDRNALNLKEAGLTNGDAIDEIIKKYFKIYIFLYHKHSLPLQLKINYLSLFSIYHFAKSSLAAPQKLASYS